MTTILLFNYPEPEQKAWKFLLRKLPGVKLLPVERGRYGLTIGELLEEKPASALRYGADFPHRMVVFAEAGGALLSLLIDLSHQVTREKTYRAMLTENNRSWTPPELLAELQEEEAQIQMRMK